MTKKIIDIYEDIPRGNEYTPFIHIQDFGSRSRVSRIFLELTNRQHDVLSDMERNYLKILNFADQVLDIREQFPLQLELTILIAQELGIKHNTNDQQLTHLTSDFVITINDNGVAKDIVRTIKSKNDLVDRRTIEKFEIEYYYWKRLGIDWAIVTDEEINKTLALNISDIMTYYNLNTIDGFEKFNNNELEDIIIAFIERIIGSNKSIRELSSIFEGDLHLNKGNGISLFKHTLARKYMKVDLLQPLDMENVIKINLTQKTMKLIGAVS